MSTEQYVPRYIIIYVFFQQINPTITNGNDSFMRHNTAILLLYPTCVEHEERLSDFYENISLSSVDIATKHSNLTTIRFLVSVYLFKTHNKYHVETW